MNKSLGTPTCLVPWKSLYIHSNGKFFPCCVIRSDVGNHSTQSLSGVWQSAAMMSLRERLLTPNLETPECESCWHREKSGVRSRRMLFDEDMKRKGATCVEGDPLRPSLDSIVHFDVSFGNLCNLACLFCSPDKSSKWQGLVKDLPQEKLFDKYRAAVRGVVNVDGEKLVQEVLSLKNLISLEIKGGEPLIHPFHGQLLKKLIESGRSQKIELLYSSNLVHLPDEVLEFWKHFKRVDISVSIDGTEKMQRYIRGNESSLETVILPNLKRLRLVPRIKVSSHTTVCAYNFFDLENLMDYLNDPNVGLVRNSIGLVHGPEHLSPYVLSKEMVVGQIEEMKSSKYEVIRNLARSLNIDRFGSDKRLQKIFIQFTKIMDRRRGSACPSKLPKIGL